jgi:hypothetical protein
MIYALGRALEPGDMPAVREIVRKAQRDDARFGALISGVAESAPFRERMREGP